MLQDDVQKKMMGCMALVLCTCKQFAPLHEWPKFSKGCKWHRMRVWAENYTITCTIHLTISTPWFLSLVMLQHVREVADLFDVGTSGLKKCLRYRYIHIRLGVPILLSRHT